MSPGLIEEPVHCTRDAQGKFLEGDRPMIRSLVPGHNLYSPDQRQTKDDMVMGGEENRHVQRYSGVASAVRRAIRRPHGLWNDSVRLTDGIVERPSVDVEVRTCILHGRTCDEEGVWPVLGDGRIKRPRVDT